MTIVERAYWALWVVTVMLTGVLAGYMVSHAIMLGRFFDWFVATDNLELLRRTYTMFRAHSNAYRVYDIPLLLHLIAGTAFAANALLLKRHRTIAVLAGLATWWVGAIFVGFGVGSAEDAVLTSTADQATAQYFLAVNIPAHSSFAAIYLTALFLLLIIPLVDLRGGSADRKRGASTDNRA